MHIEKYNETDNFSLQCFHKFHPKHNVCVHGIIVSCYTHPLVIPDLPINHALASIHTSSTCAYRLDKQYKLNVDLAVNHRVFLWQEQMLARVMIQRDN